MKLLRLLVLVVACLGLLGATAYGAGYVTRDNPRHHARPAAQAGAPADPSPTAPATPDPTTPAEPTTPAAPVFSIAPGDTGRQVRELQHRLFQLAWLPETTTGRYDGDTRAAVRGFQAKRGLEKTGVVDERTWHRLLAMTRTPTHDQMFNVLHPGPALVGPGDEGDRVRDLQARLAQIDWFQGDVTGTYGDVTTEAVRGFQAKRQIPVTGEVDRRTQDRLTAMTTTPTHAEMYNLGNQPGALDTRCRTGRVLCIDKTSQTLRWVVDGTVQKTVDVRFGASYSPTREGVFTVYRMSRDHVSSLYDSEMPFAMFFSGGQAVHYSSDFAARGYSGASHGCVNVRDYDGIAWLFDQVRIGDDVVVYWS